MTTREIAPPGAPCWVDLWTSDVEGSRAFYSALFGWVAEAPSEEFGGYFTFTRNGAPIAGGMGDMGGMAANDTWKPYVSVRDAEATIAAATAAGGSAQYPAMAITDLGVQSVLVDPSGAEIGIWQPGTFQGFGVLNEHGAPSWFELHTAEHAAELDFYRAAFGWKTSVVSDTDEFRYATVDDPTTEGGMLAGIADASSWLAGAPAVWATYWAVDDADAAAAQVIALGGSVTEGPVDTPYGKIASCADPAGATFRLRQA